MSSTPPTAITLTPSVLYFGTPVALISTLNADGSANITPMSSVWALDDRLVIGLSGASQGCANLLRTREGVVNMPGPGQALQVEAIAPTTGREDVPAYKRAMGYRFERDKFALGQFTPACSLAVAVPRIADCPIQMEVELLDARAASVVAGAAPGFMIIETRVVRFHAHERIVKPGTQHIDTGRWSPLLYVFRRYFGTGPRLGENFRSEG